MALIDPDEEDERMFGYLVLAFILVVGPLAYVYGVDSRIDERTRRDRFSG